MRRMMYLFRLIFLIPLLSGTAVLAQTHAERYMVSSAHPQATEAGLEILRAGGSAIDAAIAVQLVLTLVEPQSSGIGGGAFLMHYGAAENTIDTWDGREAAPAAAQPNLFMAADGTPMRFYDAVLGGRSVGVPGVLRAMEAAHKAYGRLPWPRLFEPAIKLATSGFSVSPRLAAAIRADAERLRRDAATRNYFLRHDGTPIPAGTRLSNLTLADTLRAIASGGADAFYRGEIAADIVAKVRSDENSGLLTIDDLTAYEARRRPPVCAPYRGMRLCSMGPPSSGGIAVLQILGMLEHFDLSQLPAGSADAAHLLAEAGRLAFADRNLYLADADFVPVPVAGLLDPAYIMLRAQQIDRDSTIERPRPGNPPWRRLEQAPQPENPENGTSHISVVDADGNAVSMTTTVEDSFGSRLMVRGFILNNQLTDFSFRPDVAGRPIANRVQGGKRPRSSMAPMLVFDSEGALSLVIGAPGGARIIGYVVQALVGVIDWQLDPQSAVGQPHVGVTGTDEVELEAATAAAALKARLEALGHRVVVREMNSGLQAIAVNPDTLQGGADPRREGMAAGD